MLTVLLTAAPTVPAAVAQNGNVDFGPDWQNWSWETTATPGPDNLAVQFDRQWAGLQFATPDATIDPVSLTTRIYGQSELSVRCSALNEGEQSVEVQRITTVPSGTTFQIDMTSCPANTAMIAFQVASPTFDTLQFQSAAVCEANGQCSAMLTGGSGPTFSCSSDAGVLTWNDDGAAKYWVYKSVDNGSSYTWLGRTSGSPAPTTFTDVAPVVGARYQVHYLGLPRVDCTISNEPSGGSPFQCASDAGALSWSDDGASKYWVYKSVDDGSSYNWIGRTQGSPAPTNFTDVAPVVGARYQVHYQGLPRVDCTITNEPSGGNGAFECTVANSVLTWSDHGASRYWVYRSTDGGASFSWLGRTAGSPAATTFTDQAPVAGAQYQVHYQGIPRVGCAGSGGTDADAHLQRILDNPTRNTIFDDNPFRDVPMDQLQVSDLTVNGDLYNEGLLDTSDSGYFRVKCEFSHFAYDDPIVIPNQPNRTHLHMFFGNTEANAFSTFESLSNSGTGTCNGEDLNRTAYWVPALLDNSGNALIPFEMMVYYKNDLFRYNGANELVSPFPDNLRLVVGNAMATAPQTARSGGPGSLPLVQFACGPAYGSEDSFGPLIPDCYGTGNGAYGPNGRALEMKIAFPQCYNPDSETYLADGSHMSYSEGGYYGIRCPDSHPMDVSSIMYRIFYSPDDYNGSLTDMHLSSDVRLDGQILPGGTTAHGDWFGAWHPAAMNLWVENCNNTQADCEIGLLGRDPLISLVPRKENGIGSGYLARPWDLLELCPTKTFDAADPLRSVANCRTQ